MVENRNNINNPEKYMIDPFRFPKYEY